MKSLQKNDELNLTAQPHNSLLYVLVCICLFSTRALARAAARLASLECPEVRNKEFTDSTYYKRFPSPKYCSRSPTLA